MKMQAVLNPIPTFGNVMSIVKKDLATVLGVMAERRRLRKLTDTQLDDIGLSRTEAEHEANRPFWDMPVR